MPIKILHTSDLHLEAKLDFLGEKSQEHRKQLIKTFKEVIAKAVADKYDLVLIAGDLFDTPFPGEKTKSEVIESFKTLAENKIHLAVIAGNHDRLEQGSVYLDKRFSEFNPEFIHIFNNPDEVSWVIAGLDLTVYGVSLTKQKDNSSPLSKIQAKNAVNAAKDATKDVAKDATNNTTKNTAQTTTKYTIALLHGSLDLNSDSANNPLNPSELAKMNFNYIALGDWHSTRQVSLKPSIWYSGSPELIHIDQTGAGNFLSIEIDNGTKVTPIKIGQKESLKLTLDITGVKTLTDLAQKWRQLGVNNAQQKFIQLVLTGVKDLTVKFSETEIKDYLSDKVYYLKLKDTTKLELTDDELDNFPEEFLAGKYIRLLQKKKGEDYSQNKVIDEAIQLGVKLLQDRS